MFPKYFCKKFSTVETCVFSQICGFAYDFTSYIRLITFYTVTKDKTIFSICYIGYQILLPTITSNEEQNAN